MRGSGTQADPFIIENLQDLQDVNNDLTAFYELESDIDASATVGWNAGLGFDPIGTIPNDFDGNFDGKGFNIINLFINRPLEGQVGLFGSVFGGATGAIRNVTLENCDITGQDWTGALIGRAAGLPGTIENCHSSGSITGNNDVGGLIGYLLIGCSSCSSSCNVSESAFSARDFGGLAGLSQGTVNRCFATGNVNAPTCQSVGGLIGWHGTDLVSDCYARGDVVGDDEVGGFIGTNNGGPIDNCYSTGSVSGTTNVGGFCGRNNDVITDSFWDTETSGMLISDGGTGRTTAQMFTRSTFTDAGWDPVTIWGFFPGSYPCLRGVSLRCSDYLPQPVTLAATGVT